MKENIEKLMLMGFGIIAISFLIITSAKAQPNSLVTDRAVHCIIDLEKLGYAVRQMDDAYIPETPELKKDIWKRKQTQEYLPRDPLLYQ